VLTYFGPHFQGRRHTWRRTRHLVGYCFLHSRIARGERIRLVRQRFLRFARGVRPSRAGRFEPGFSAAVLEFVLVFGLQRVNRNVLRNVHDWVHLVRRPSRAAGLHVSMGSFGFNRPDWPGALGDLATVELGHLLLLLQTQRFGRESLVA